MRSGMKSDSSEWLSVTLLLLLQSSASVSEVLQLVGPAAPVVVSPGEDAVLPCYLSPSVSAEDLEIRWFRGDCDANICFYQNGKYNSDRQDPTYRGRVELFSNELSRGNVSLTLRNITRSDQGEYRCMVLSDLWKDDTVIDLSVRAMSVSLHSPGGDQAQLLCRSEGWFPQPAVIWTDRDGNEVTSQPPTVDMDRQGLLSVSSYIPVKQESNIFSCLVRSALPEPDWGSQLHIPRDYFPAPSGWMVALFLTAAVTVAASVLLVIQWRRMDRKEKLTEWRWICSASAAVTLDPDTAHYELSLSEDGKRVRLGQMKSLSDNRYRFDHWPCVLSREAFTSGRHYWELEVNDCWTIGVTIESAERKGKFSFCPQQGYWCLKSYWAGFFALTDPATCLPLSLQLRKLGVCVDIEKRKVSFYTVESRAHLYTFTDMVFPQGEKIYPVFWTGDEYKDLELLPAVSVEI